MTRSRPSYVDHGSSLVVPMIMVIELTRKPMDDVSNQSYDGDLDTIVLPAIMLDNNRLVLRVR